MHPGGGALYCIGFCGAALLISGSAQPSGTPAYAGYGFALVSAFIWATYSLLTRRFAAFPTSYVAWFCAASGAAALACHFAFEERYWPSASQWPYLVAMGLGPMGAAFYLWDRAMKRGDPRVIGNLAYLTPLLSTLLLAAFAGQHLTARSFLAMAIILGAASLGTKTGL